MRRFGEKLGWVSFFKISAAVFLVYLPFAGWMSIPLTGDQKVYLSTALEMESSGSTLIPVLFGEPSYYKPPLQYWATIASIRQWGYSLFGALLPSVLMAWLAAVCIGSIAARLWPETKEPHARAGLWFLASLGTATYGITAQMEIYLVAVNALCWSLALDYLERSSLDRLRNPWALYAAWLVAGLGAVVKSPLYSALWGVGFWIHLAVNREWREFKNPHHWLAFVFGSLVGAAWFGVVYHLDGEALVSQYFLRETAAKFGGNGGSIAELWQGLLVSCLPWAPLAVLGLIQFARKGSRALTGFVVGSALPAALFFTAYPYRISPYLYVVVPTLALLAAWAESERGAGLRWTQKLTALFIGSVVAYVAWVGMRARIFPAPMNAVTVALAAIWFWAFWVPRRWITAALALVFWYHMAAVSLGERDLQGLRDFAEQNPHRGLSMLDESQNIWHEVGLLSLAVQKPIERLSSVDEVIDALEDGQAVVLSREQSEAFGSEIREAITEESDGRELEVVHWKRLSTRKELPLSDLLRARRKLEFNRDFQILTLPADLNREVPEGGV